MDWSYSYEIALYFAVENVLKGDKKDCALWAFNYKPFEKFSSCRLPDVVMEGEPQLRFYRPEYNTNSNLKAQKGLFTFIISPNNAINMEPLDEVVCRQVRKYSLVNEDHEMVIKLPGASEFKLNDNEKIFYKFNISGKIKHHILKELYLDGFSEEFLFPGYEGVRLAMKNKIDLCNYFEDNGDKI